MWWGSPLLTYDGRAVCCAGQQVVHDEQEDGVAQDEGHLKGGAVDTMGGQVEGQDVDDHEEGAGDQQVDHIENWLALYDHLVKSQFEESQQIYCTGHQ